MRRILITTLFLTISLICSDSLAHQWCFCSNQENTYGWQLMTPEERKAHQTRLASLTDYKACKEYIDQHHEQMEQKAREKGLELQDMSKTPCDSLRDNGGIK